MAYDFTNKSIAIVGMARSGMAAADVLARLGGKIHLYDGKPADALLVETAWAESRGIPVSASAAYIDKADIAVVSPGVRINSPIMLFIREQKIEIWGEIEAAYRIAKAPILAITGTNGKTTTALLLAEMLRSAGITTYAAGNIAAGSIAQPLIAAADLATGTDAIVAEISSFQLETISSFRPKVAALLNITSDHQDRQTWEEYVASKWRLFENQGEGDTAVLSRSMPEPSQQPRLPRDIRFFDTADRPPWLSHLRIPGEHNRLNALAASTMASALGVPAAAIEASATLFTGVVHRLEFVADVDGVTYINNSMCTNNAAFHSSLSAVEGRKIVITGGVFKGGDMTELAAAVAATNVKLVVAFGRSGPDISEVVKACTNVPSVVVNTLVEAVSAASNESKAGDTIILNPGCSSFDQFNDFEDRGDQFKALVSSLGKVNGIP
jgi:UDP-N-acetylmuramoylalanine--D-glutamate ligase